MINAIKALGDNLSFKTFADILHIVNQVTEDNLFLWEFETGNNWYFSDVYSRFPIRRREGGYSLNEDVLAVVHPKDRPALVENLRQLLKGETDEHDMEYRWIDKNGNPVWISCRGMVLHNDEHKPVAMLGRVSDTALKHLVDSKTGLFNKMKMFEVTEEIFAQGRKGHFILFGVDHLKTVNMNYGRKQGDVILRQVAQVLLQDVINPRFLFRMDGDLFGLCSYVENKEELIGNIRRVQEQLREVCTLSVGAVAYDDAMVKEPSYLYQEAENMLGKAKKGGDGQIAFYHAAEAWDESAALSMELRRSIENGFEGFHLVYQPIVQLKPGKPGMTETLLRYTSAERGPVYPDEFIPILEKTGMIRAVGMWVLEQAIIDCKSWQEKYGDYRITVNFSYEQLTDPEIGDKVLALLEKHQLPGEALYIELTESMQLQNFKYYNALFRKWQDHGVEIAIDDFGTGYSSLSYLKNLEVDIIKIDRAFVQDIKVNAYNYMLIRNIVELADSAEIYTCCEGVETAEELEVLRELGATMAQGYYFAKPMPKEAMDDFIAHSTQET